MGEDRHKLAKELTVEELDAFVTELASKPGKERTLRNIIALAAQRGITISITSAKAFRDTTFERYLARIKRRAEKAAQIAQIAGDGSGRAINEATLGILAEKIFDELNTDDDGTDDDEEPARLDMEKIDTLTKAAARIQKGFGDVDRVQLAVEKFQWDGAKEVLAKLDELKVIATNRTLGDDEKIEQVRLKLWGAVPKEMEGKA